MFGRPRTGSVDGLRAAWTSTLCVFHILSQGECFRTIDPLTAPLDTEQIWPVIRLFWGTGSRCITAPATSWCRRLAFLSLIRAVLSSWNRALCSGGSKSTSAGKSPINILCVWKKSRKAKRVTRARGKPPLCARTKRTKFLALRPALLSAPLHSFHCPTVQSPLKS
jgi:hypothetical protein